MSSIHVVGIVLVVSRNLKKLVPAPKLTILQPEQIRDRSVKLHTPIVSLIYS